MPTQDNIKKETFGKIFNPTCPNCHSSDTVDQGEGKALYNFTDIMNRSMGKKEDSHVYRCNKCGTVWDDKGGKFQVK